jgi:hypothetical protein
LRSEENIGACVGKVLDGVGDEGVVSAGHIRKILDEVFWNWEGSA